MADDLHYIPPRAPENPFCEGDDVEVLDRLHKVLSIQTVTEVRRRRVKTTCGRWWTIKGLWINDDEKQCPFPSIRHKIEKNFPSSPLDGKMLKEIGDIAKLKVKK